VFRISIWGAWSFVWEAKPTNPPTPRGDGTETEQLITPEISGNALKQGSITHSVTRQPC